MAVLKQNLLVGTAGAAITPANSASGGDAFSAVAGSPVYDTGQKMHGATSARFAAGTGQKYLAYTLAVSSTLLAARGYFRFSSNPTAHNQNVISLYGGSTLLNGLDLGTDGRLSIRTPTGTGYYVTPVGSSVNLNTWYRFEIAWNISSTTGSVNVRIYLGDSTTVLWTINPTNINTGSTKGTEVRFGSAADSTSSTGQFWVDEPGVRDSTMLLLGPYSPPNPTVDARAAVNGQAATLSAVVSTYDNVAPSYKWTQTAGPAATLSSSTAAAPTLSALAAGNYTFSLTITDSAAHTATDTVSFSVAAPPTAPVTPPAQDQGNPVASVAMYANVFVIDASASQGVNGGALAYSISPSAGLTQVEPGVWVGVMPDAPTSYTVLTTENSSFGTRTASAQATVPAKPTAATAATGGGFVVLVANADASRGGAFVAP